MIKTKREEALEKDIALAVDALVDALSNVRIAMWIDVAGVSNGLPLRLLHRDIEKALALLDWSPSPDDSITYQE